MKEDRGKLRFFFGVLGQEKKKKRLLLGKALEERLRMKNHFWQPIGRFRNVDILRTSVKQLRHNIKGKSLEQEWGRGEDCTCEICASAGGCQARISARNVRGEEDVAEPEI